MMDISFLQTNIHTNVFQVMQVFSFEKTYELELWPLHFRCVEGDFKAIFTTPFEVSTTNWMGKGYLGKRLA